MAETRLKAPAVWAAMLACALLTIACTPAPDAGETLRNVPLPVDLEALDPPVREELERRHAAVESLLQDSAATDAQLAKAFGELGKMLHAYLYHDSAETCYSVAERLASDAYEWAYLRGRVLRILGRWQDSENTLARALELRPGDVPSLVSLADGAFDRDLFDQAEDFYRRALERSPECAACLWGLGRVHLAKGDAVAAVKSLEEALAWQPRASQIHYSLGLAYRATGDLDRARSHLERVAGDNLTRDGLAVDDPAMNDLEDLRVGARAHDFRGLKALSEGRYALAAIEFRQAMLADPDRVYAGYGLALALVNLGRWEEAEAELDKLLAAAPEHGPSRLLMARVDIHGGRFQEAEEHLGTVMRNDPDSLEARLEIAAIRRDTGRLEEALELYDQILSHDPGTELARFWSAVTRVYQGRHAASLAAVEADREALPESRKLRWLHARLLAATPDSALRDGARALELARAAAAAAPTLAAAESVAMAYAELGRLDDAIQWQQAAVDATKRARGSAEWASERLQRYRRGQPCREPWARSELLSELPVEPPESL